LPTFGNRQITTTIRLKDGETNMLAGLIRDEDRKTLDGVPGLSDLPIVGRLFAANHVETIETDVVLMVTPRIIRVLDLKAEDLAAFRVGREGGSSAIVEFPSNVPGEPPTDPGAPPAQRPGQVTPVRPPKPPGG
jgi:general secretion pathway protein D